MRDDDWPVYTPPQRRRVDVIAEWAFTLGWVLSPVWIAALIVLLTYR